MKCCPVSGSNSSISSPNSVHRANRSNRCTRSAASACRCSRAASAAFSAQTHTDALSDLSLDLWVFAAFAPPGTTLHHTPPLSTPSTPHTTLNYRKRRIRKARNGGVCETGLARCAPKRGTAPRRTASRRTSDSFGAFFRRLQICVVYRHVIAAEVRAGRGNVHVRHGNR